MKHKHEPGSGRDAKGRAICLICRRKIVLKIVEGVFGWRLS